MSACARSGWVVLAPLLAAIGGWAGEAPAAVGVVAEPALPRWEAGIAAGAGYVSDYPGAERSSARGIVLPMVIYRGPVLRIDDDGIRGRLLDTARWQFDLSGTAAFNAKNNELRRGMPPIDYLFGVGPQWIYKGLRSPRDGPTLHLKLRALMSTDGRRIDAHGLSFDPELRWRHTVAAAPSSALTLSLQSSWASQPLHRYLYQVEPAQSSTARPAYSARAGYLGTELAFTLSQRRAPGLSWFATARLMSLHGAANQASPLLRRHSHFNLGAGVIWTPWRSSDPGSL